MSVSDIVTPPFRLAFPQIFVPKPNQRGIDEYAVTMLFKKPDDLMWLRQLLREGIVSKWGADKKDWPAELADIDLKTHISLKGKDGWPIRDGDKVPWQGFAGHLFARAKSNDQIGAVDQNRQPILDYKMIPAGVICRARINAWGYDKSGNPGVGLGVSHIQLLEDDGVRFTGRIKAEDAFDSWAASPAATGTDGDMW